jgi:hypothetical protein
MGHGLSQQPAGVFQFVGSVEMESDFSHRG